MKDTTRRRKNAIRGIEAAFGGRQEIIDQMFRVFAQGRQSLDECMKGLERLAAETIMYIEREEKAGSDYQPVSPHIRKWAGQGGSSYLWDQKIAMDHPRLRGPEGEIALRNHHQRICFDSGGDCSYRGG